MAKRPLQGLKLAILLLAALVMAAQCSDANLSITAPPTDFGPTIVGSNPTLTLTVTNAGNADAILGTVSTVGLGLAKPFSHAGGTCVSRGRVAANGGSCTLVVRFAPTEVALFEALVSLSYNWDDSGVDARSARIALSGSNPGVVQDQSAEFANTYVGETSRRTVLLRNYHGVDAILDSIEVDSSHEQAFVVEGGTCSVGAVLNARGGTCSLQVAFTPQKSIHHSLLVHAYYRWRDDTNAQIAYVHASGNGVVPLGVSIFKPARVTSDDEVIAGAFPFGPLSTGSVVTKEFWVTNRRPEAVLLTDLSTASAGLSAPFSLVGGTCLDQPLLPADFGQCSLRVRFAPTALMAVNDSIDVEYRLQTSGTTGIVSRALSGAGVPVDPVTSISAGVGNHVCALLASGNVRCWGGASSFYGALGYGDGVDYGLDYFPNSAGNVRVGGTVTQIAAALGHTCALLSGGSVRCWGSPNYGRLGYGNTSSFNNPPELQGDVPVGERVLRITTGGHHTCALLEGGRARCWGPGFSGQLGYGHPSDIGDNEPPSAAGDAKVGGFIEQIVTGVYHTCARLSGGNVRCWGWGENDIGALGYGIGNVTIGDNELPSTAGDVPLGGAAVELAAGAFHTCAILTTGNVRCWGKNDAGQLGYGHTRNIGDDETPASTGDVNVGGSVRQVSAGYSHTCAVLDTGSVRCWGGADSFAVAKLGYGNTNPIGDNEPPASAGDVNVGGPVSQVVAGRHFTCALLDTQKVRCWGYATAGLDGNFPDSGGWLGYGNAEHVGDNELPFTAGDVPVQ